MFAEDIRDPSLLPAIFLLLHPGLTNPAFQDGSHSFHLILSSRSLAQLEFRPLQELFPGFLLPWVLGANLDVWVVQKNVLVLVFALPSSSSVFSFFFFLVV